MFYFSNPHCLVLALSILLLVDWGVFSTGEKEWLEDPG